MPHLNIVAHLDLDARPELEGKVCHHVQTFTIGGLSAGMASGKPSVGIIIDLGPGAYVFCETSLALLLAAADALKTAHGDPRDGTPPATAH